MSAPIRLGWHFLPVDSRLAYGDGRLVVAGEWIAHDGPLVLCESGLHWSARALDALRYAPGPVACRIEARGETIEAGDKCVSAERRAVWMLSALVSEPVLHAFARQCAALVLPLWGGPVPASVSTWLVEGGEEMREEVWAEACTRTRWAIREAAWDSDGVSYLHAAVEAARSATIVLARSAAEAAVERVAAVPEGRLIDKVVLKARAWSEAWDAAKEASEAMQNAILEDWLVAAHEDRWQDIVVRLPAGLEDAT